MLLSTPVSRHRLFYLRGDAPGPSLCADGCRADAFRALANVGRVHDAVVAEGTTDEVDLSAGADTDFESLGLPVVAAVVVVVVEVAAASNDRVGDERVRALVSRLQLLFLCSRRSEPRSAELCESDSGSSRSSCRPNHGCRQSSAMVARWSGCTRSILRSRRRQCADMPGGST